MPTNFRSTGLILATLLLGACGEKPAPINPPAADPTTAPVADDSSAKLAVVNFSPKGTPVDTPFNVQLDGNSGISFELSRPAPAAEFKAWFDNKPLTGVVASNAIVTATIPAEYLATAGEFPIEIEVGGMRLPAGTFVVEPR